MFGDNTLVVIFRAAGHTWRASYDGCFDVGVTRAGAALRAPTTSTSQATAGPPHQGDFLAELTALGIRVP